MFLCGERPPARSSRSPKGFASPPTPRKRHGTTGFLRPPSTPGAPPPAPAETLLPRLPVPGILTETRGAPAVVGFPSRCPPPRTVNFCLSAHPYLPSRRHPSADQNPAHSDSLHDPIRKQEAQARPTEQAKVSAVVSPGLHRRKGKSGELAVLGSELGTGGRGLWGPVSQAPEHFLHHWPLGFANNACYRFQFWKHQSKALILCARARGPTSVCVRAGTHAPSSLSMPVCVSLPSPAQGTVGGMTGAQSVTCPPQLSTKKVIRSGGARARCASPVCSAVRSEAAPGDLSSQPTPGKFQWGPRGPSRLSPVQQSRPSLPCH